MFPSGAEILVVDGGTDRTGRIVQELAEGFPSIRYIANPDDRGKGHAMHVGLAAAAGTYIAQIDADLQFLPRNFHASWSRCRNDVADLVLGSRFATGARRLPGSTPAVRTFGNWVVSRVCVDAVRGPHDRRARRMKPGNETGNRACPAGRRKLLVRRGTAAEGRAACRVSGGGCADHERTLGREACLPSTWFAMAAASCGTSLAGSRFSR